MSSGFSWQNRGPPAGIHHYVLTCWDALEECFGTRCEGPCSTGGQMIFSWTLPSFKWSGNGQEIKWYIYIYIQYLCIIDVSYVYTYLYICLMNTSEVYLVAAWRGGAMSLWPKAPPAPLQRAMELFFRWQKWWLLLSTWCYLAQFSLNPLVIKLVRRGRT